jgi:hypothetical protein
MPSFSRQTAVLTRHLFSQNFRGLLSTLPAIWYRLSETRKMLGELLAEVELNRDSLTKAYAQQLLGKLALKEKDYATAQAN